MGIIGIDLGTTNSLVACFTEEGATIIPNRLGENLTPSIVSMDETGEIFIGKIAKERQISHPEYTTSVFKRNMGTKKEMIVGGKKFLPEELSSFVIRALKEDAEVYMKEPVTEAVISVPAYFNDTQRKATKRAGELAGLKVGRIINEPTAAAMAYGLHEKKEHTKFLVFDLGGGTFDISILEHYKNIMEVRAVAGDNFLGGEDFTKILLTLFLKEHHLDIEQLGHKTIAILNKQAELAKRAFGIDKKVTMRCKIEEEELEYTISLEEYEKACQPLIARLRKPIERALRDAAIKVAEIDDIVLVGGATKLSIIRSFVSKLFGRLPSLGINPDEAVALGAGIQAAMKARNALIKEIVLTDVCPYTLGTNVAVQKMGGEYVSGHFFPIIERNTIIPVSRIEKLYTIYDRQKAIAVEILQGESRLTKDNIYLGEINIDVPPAPKGQEGVGVRYTYDINGILEVEVEVLSTGAKKRMVIEKNPGDMSQEEVEERLKELENIKIHPRDQEDNKLLLAKGERLYEETVGEVRFHIASYLKKYEEILERQDNNEIQKATQELRELLNEIEEEQEF